MPAWRVSILPRLDQVPMANSVSTFFSQTKKGTAISSVAASQRPLTTEPNRSGHLLTKLSLSTIVMLIWLTGLVLLMNRLFVGVLSVSRIRRRASHDVDHRSVHLAQEIKRQLGIRQSFTLLMSREVSVPMACGLFRPAILLPLTTLSWSGKCCEAVLRHELAHIKRHDCQTQTLAQAVCALYWFNPLVWWAAKQMRIERELACDDQVLGGGTRATEYAHHLLEIVKGFRFNQRASIASAGFACSQLEARVRSILDANINRRHLSRTSVSLISLVMGCSLLFVAAIEPRRSVASTSNLAASSEVDALLATTPGFAATNSKSDSQRPRKPVVTRVRVVATGGKTTTDQLTVAPIAEIRAGVSVSSSSTSSSISSSQSTSAITSGATTYAITRTDVTVTHGSDRGSGMGFGQGFGRGPN